MKTGTVPGIIFWGTPSFAAPLLKALHDTKSIRAVVTQPDRPQGRGQKIVIPSAVKEFAAAHHIPVLQPERLDAEFSEQLKKYLPALFCVVAYGSLIPASILSLSQPAAVNVHPSLLPDLRGPSPIQTAIRKGYAETGITLMQLDAELDHGPIIAQKKIALDGTETAESLSKTLADVTAEFIPQTIAAYAAGTMKPHAQDHARATHSKRMERTDGELVFSLSATELDRIMRSCMPWPGAYFIWKKKRIKVVSAQPVADRAAKRFTMTPDHTLRIACAEGSLDVAMLQPENARAMSARDFVNGYPEILES